MQSLWIFATVTGKFSSIVTLSQAVIGRSQAVTPVAALSTVCIGVTTLCIRSICGKPIVLQVKHTEIMLGDYCQHSVL